MSGKRTAFGGLSKFNHWIAALLVLAMLALGLLHEEVDRDWRNIVLGWHIALGGIAAPFILWRVLYRLGRGFPQDHPGPRWQQLVARLVHWALLANIAVLAVSGPLTVWAKGHGIDVFGWFVWPSPFGEWDDLEDVMEDVHETAANIVMYLIGIHLAAVLKHTLIDRDGLLRRMLPGKSA